LAFETPGRLPDAMALLRAALASILGTHWS
jgi:hypothetical protein